jgi:hypothetical protein
VSDEQESALKRWAAVPATEKKRVATLARQGHRHPDPAIVAAAEGWAQVLLDANDRSDEPRLLRWVFNLVDWTSSIWWLLVPENVSQQSERVWARRVLGVR